LPERYLYEVSANDSLRTEEHLTDEGGLLSHYWL